MEKTYVILGDNNYWYSTFKASTELEIAGAIQEVKLFILNTGCPLGDPEVLSLVEVKFVGEFKIDPNDKEER